MFGFKVAEAMKILGFTGVENTIRNYIKTSETGCNGVRIKFAKGQKFGSHIKRRIISAELLSKLDSGKQNNYFDSSVQ